MRLTTKLLCGVLTMVMAFGLFGCSPSDNEDKNNDVEIENITDFSKFSTMEQITDRIEVTFDNNSGVPFYFAIENEADIDEIMEIIFSSSFKKRGKEINDGNHTSIKIIQGDREYVMHTSNNKNGDYYYSFSTTELYDKIVELAREAGAYENVN